MPEVSEVVQSKFIELPEHWTPDPATLEWVAVRAAQELMTLGNQHGLLLKGSERHLNMGRMQGLTVLARYCIENRDAVLAGKFGAEESPLIVS